MKYYILKFDKSKRREYSVDIKEYFEKYQIKKDNISSGYKMLVGTPVLLNIEGTYVKSDDLPKICKSSPSLLYNYLSLLKNPSEGKEVWYLIWS